MNIQKFLFAQASAKPNELRLNIANLHFDIKNICGMIQYYGNEIGTLMPSFHKPESVKLINEHIQSINKLISEYDLCCQQSKLLKNRLLEVLKALPVSM